MAKLGHKRLTVKTPDQIEAEVEKLERNRINISYLIDKGKKAKIAKIYFLGDKQIREKKLRDIITSQEAKFWKLISRNVYLSKERVDLDKRLLKNYTTINHLTILSSCSHP